MNFIIYLFAVLKNVIYGSSVLFTGRLTRSTDVLDILALRFLMSFAVMLFLKYSKLVKINVSLKDISKKSPKSKSMRSLILCGFFEPVLYMLFETLGISMTRSITASVILSLAPVSNAISEILILKETTDWKKNLFLAIGTIGIIYIAVNTKSTGNTDTFIGIMFVVLAVITGSLYSVFSRKSSSEFSALDITYFTSFMGAAVFNTANIARHLYVGDISSYFTPYMNIYNLAGFVFLAVISTVVATGMNNYALARMQVSTMGAFSGISTATAIAEGVIFNKEVLYPFHIIGISLIIVRMVGMMWLARKSNGKYVNNTVKKMSYSS